MASNKNSSSTTNRMILVVASVLVLTALAYFTIKYFSEKSKNQEKSTQITDLTTEILDLEEQIFELNSDLEEKDMDLAAKEKKIDDNQEKILQLLNQLSEAKKKDKTQTDLIRDYEKRLTELKGLLDNYENQIALLKDENNILYGRIDSLQVTQVRMQEQYLTLKASNDENLQQLEQTVQKASVLRASDYQFFSVSKKGKTREETAFRKRTLKELKVCFNIGANLVAEAGLRDIYVLLENPDGSLNINFSEGYSGTFQSPAGEKTYSTRARLDYNHREEKVCMDYIPEANSKFQKGTHNLYVYTDGRIIGQSSFEVK